MNMIDISWPISSHMTAYKDKKRVQIEHIKTMEHDNVRETMMQIGSHSGTHVDAPSHFVHDGITVDQLALNLFVGPCVVLDCMHIQECITAHDLAAMSITKGMIVLLKTRNSLLSPDAPFNPSFIYLDATGAEYLVQQQIKSVGIDYLGIERNQPDHGTHINLMRNGIGIIEGLRLQATQPGNYTLWCLPLAVIGVEAVPARAILVVQ